MWTDNLFAWEVRGGKNSPAGGCGRSAAAFEARVFFVPLTALPSLFCTYPGFKFVNFYHALRGGLRWSVLLSLL